MQFMKLVVFANLLYSKDGNLHNITHTHDIIKTSAIKNKNIHRINNQNK